MKPRLYFRTWNNITLAHMVVVIVVVAGIHALRSSGGELLSCFSSGKTQTETQNPERKTQKQNPEHIMTLVVQFPNNATKIDEGYRAHEPWYFRP